MVRGFPDVENSSAFLVVENDPNDALLIRRALKFAGCGNSFLCRNAGEAKAYLKGAGMYSDRAKFPLPSLILTDLKMDGESGIDLVKWIREQQPPLGEKPVLILTGSATALQFEEAQKAGAQGVHRKPTRLEDLQTLLAGIAAEFCPPHSKAS